MNINDYPFVLPPSYEEDSEEYWWINGKLIMMWKNCDIAYSQGYTNLYGQKSRSGWEYALVRFIIKDNKRQIYKVTLLKNGRLYGVDLNI